MVFGRKTGFLSSWGASKPAQETDLEFAARAHKLDVLHKTLVELQDNMRLYLASWQAMCQASAAIAEGLSKLAGGGSGVSSGVDGGIGGVRISPLMDMARMYHSEQHTIDGFVREPAQRIAEETALRETGALLSRFPPIFGKITRRRQLLADVELAKTKVRAGEAAKDKERDSFAAVAGAENRRRASAALETASAVAKAMTQEVIADAERLEGERETMLVPQVSALVGCQAYFMRRSAMVLERLASKLPFSALALCRLVRPSALEAVGASASAGAAARASPSARRALPSAAAAAASLKTGGVSVSVSDFGFGGQPTHGGGGGYGSVASHPTVGLQQTPSPSARTPAPLPQPPPRRGGDGDGDGILPPAAAGSSPPGSSPWTVAGTSILANQAAGNGVRAPAAGVGGGVDGGGGTGSLLLPSPPLVEGAPGGGGWRAASAGSDYDDDGVVEEVAWS